MKNPKPTNVITGEVRISYEHLLEPFSNQQGVPPKYSATLLIPKSDVQTRQRIDAAIAAAIQEGPKTKWGGVQLSQPPVPIHDGDGVRPSDNQPFGAECKGHWVMTASSKNQPQIVDNRLQSIMDATQIYSGMYAKVFINFFPYASAGKKGIGAGLGPVQKTRDGEPLGSRVNAEDVFDAVAAPAAPAYQQPAYPQQQYAAAPQQPYAAPQQPWHAPAQPAYPQTPPVAGAQINPVTGQPYTPMGGVMGIG